MDADSLQRLVNRAFAEPDYVDTGDLINALHGALEMLENLGTTITIPTHEED